MIHKGKSDRPISLTPSTCLVSCQRKYWFNFMGHETDNSRACFNCRLMLP